MNETRRRFGLTLMMNHACNLRCTYCYTGAKFNSSMPVEIAIASINRGYSSLGPGGHLDLSFFGGEPLLEAVRILDLMAYSRKGAVETGKQVRFNLTTNGTVDQRDSWRVMMADDLDLAVSLDGLPEMHDRHRCDAQGRGTSRRVEAMLKQLIAAGKDVRVNVVVRPDTLDHLAEGLIYLHQSGIRHVDLSLDLWTKWTVEDGRRLEDIIDQIAELWHGWLPEFALNWFDAKAGDLAGLSQTHEDTRCGFGDGEIAVAPSGRLYPCERLIGEDRPDHPLRLPGHALEGRDFLTFAGPSINRCAACYSCMLNSACDTTCRCSNFIRTGNVDRPDGLLCILNKATARAVSDIFLEDRRHYAKQNVTQSTGML